MIVLDNFNKTACSTEFGNVCVEHVNFKLMSEIIIRRKIIVEFRTNNKPSLQ